MRSRSTQAHYMDDGRMSELVAQQPLPKKTTIDMGTDAGALSADEYQLPQDDDTNSLPSLSGIP